MTDLQAKERELARVEARFAQARAVFTVRRETLRTEIRELRESAAIERKSRAGVSLDAHTQAGRENLRRVREKLELGPATQARLCELLGINSGTMTWCLRALIEEGAARETGVRVRNSREVELLPSGRVSTAPPGSDGVFRRAD